MIWLMDGESIKQLQNTCRLLMKNQSIKVESIRDSYTLQNASVLKIHGPIFSRPNFFTEIMGLKSTECYMKEFQQLESLGMPILLDIDTGGGDAALIFEFADMIHNSSCETISYTGGAACSAGFMLHQACDKKYAYNSAMLGSIGVVGHIDLTEPDFEEVTSKNADNKRPDKEGIQNRINQIEDIFINKLSEFTGMSNDEIIKAGNNGDVFTGSHALASNFLDDTKGLQGVINNIEESRKLTTETDSTDQLKEYKDRISAISKMGCTDVERLTLYASSDMSLEDVKLLVEKDIESEKHIEDVKVEKVETKVDTKDESKDVLNGKNLMDVLQTHFSQTVNSVSADDVDPEPEPEKTQKELDDEWIAQASKEFNQIQGRK